MVGVNGLDVGRHGLDPGGDGAGGAASRSGTSASTASRFVGQLPAFRDQPLSNMRSFLLTKQEYLVHLRSGQRSHGRSSCKL